MMELEWTILLVIYKNWKHSVSLICKKILEVWVASPLPWKPYSARLMHGRSKVTRTVNVSTLLRQVSKMLEKSPPLGNYTRRRKTSSFSILIFVKMYFTWLVARQTYEFIKAYSVSLGIHTEFCLIKCIYKSQIRLWTRNRRAKSTFHLWIH
jgi:hypothetical protein